MIVANTYQTLYVDIDRVTFRLAQCKAQKFKPEFITFLNKV